MDNPVSSALHSRDRTLKKPLESARKECDSSLNKNNKKGLGFQPLARSRSAGCGGWMASGQLAEAEAEAAAFLV